MAFCNSLTTSLPSTPEHLKFLLQLISRPTARPSCLHANENVKPSCSSRSDKPCSATNLAMHSAKKSNNCQTHRLVDLLMMSFGLRQHTIDRAGLWHKHNCKQMPYDVEGEGARKMAAKYFEPTLAKQSLTFYQL